MGGGSNLVLKSYVKTTSASLVVVVVSLILAVLCLYWLPELVGKLGAALFALLTLGAITAGCAGVVVLVRYGRGARGERDLFLELNRSREPSAIKAAGTAYGNRARRRLARQLLGHDLLVGDLVEIKPWAEIRATLDQRGCLEQLPFMPEMLAMCGQRAYVFRCAHRIFDYRKTRRMRHLDGAVLLVGTVCDGSKHGNCNAACHTIWKAAWLRRVEQAENSTVTHAPSDPGTPANDTGILQSGTEAPRYSCQLTQLNAASQPVGNWSVVNFLRPLAAGNVSSAAFIVAWLTHLFNELQQRRRGVGFPEFEAAADGRIGPHEERLEAGDQVIVRSSAEIRATLNDQFMHRGLWFEPDMLKYCGGRHRVQAEVTRLVDIVTGEMLTMKTPAYILEDVHFSGERQLFNAQYEPLYWRAVWLKRVGEGND